MTCCRRYFLNMYMSYSINNVVVFLSNVWLLIYIGICFNYTTVDKHDTNNITQKYENQ